jgi:hypothetical protein
MYKSLFMIFLLCCSNITIAQTTVEERKKRDREMVLGYYKTFRIIDKDKKFCVYDVHGKERTVMTGRNEICPPQVYFRPNK